MELQGFINIGAMGGKKFAGMPDKACRPFDSAHEGFIYGQAGGCIILESGESAENRGVASNMELAGGALVLDGNHLPDPNIKGEIRAMEKAVESALIGREEISYINAHGSSSPLGDQTEVKAIENLFRENLKDIRVNSLKPYTGHCLYSAGIIEAIATIIQMREGFLFPCLNLENPISDNINFVNHHPLKIDIRTSMSNSFGFGGINSSIIFRKKTEY